MVRESRHLKITNVPSSVSQDDLRCFFSSYGRVQRVEVLKGGSNTSSDDSSPSSAASSDKPSVAIVSFMDLRTAARAFRGDLELNGKEMQASYHDPTTASGNKGVRPAAQINIHESAKTLVVAAEKTNGPSTPPGDNGLSQNTRSRISQGTSSRNTNDIAGTNNRDLHSTRTNGERRRSSSEKRRSAANGAPTRSEKAKHSRSPHSDRGSSRSSSRSPGSRSPTSSRSSSKQANSYSSGNRKRDDKRDSDLAKEHDRGAATTRKTTTRGKSEDLPPPPAVVVRKLPPMSTDKHIKEGLYHKYKKYGKVVSIKVCGENDNRHAIVTFRRYEDIHPILNCQEETFLGSRIVVEKAPTTMDFSMSDDNEKKPLVKDFDEYHPSASRTLYIGNLDSRGLTNEMLRDLFTQFGEVLDIDIKNANTPAPFAFVQYADIKSVVKAMHKKDGDYMGYNRMKLGFGKSLATNVVWLDDVAETVTQSTLIRKFSFYGRVNDATIDRYSRQALVYFESKEIAGFAVQDMKGRKLGDRRVQIDFASRELQDIFLDRVDRLNYASNASKEYLRSDDPRYAADVLTGPYYSIDPAIDRLYDPRSSSAKGDRYSSRDDRRYDSSRRDYSNGPSSGRYTRDHHDQNRKRSLSPPPMSERRQRDSDIASSPSSVGGRRRFEDEERIKSNKRDIDSDGFDERSRTSNRSADNIRSRSPRRNDRRRSPYSKPTHRSSSTSEAKPIDLMHRSQASEGHMQPVKSLKNGNKAATPGTETGDRDRSRSSSSSSSSSSSTGSSGSSGDSSEDEARAASRAERLAESQRLRDATESNTPTKENNVDVGLAAVKGENVDSFGTVTQTRHPSLKIEESPAAAATTSTTIIYPGGLPPSPRADSSVVSNASGAESSAAESGNGGEIPDLLKKKQELLALLDKLDDGQESSTSDTSSAGQAKKAAKLSEIFDLNWQRKGASDINNEQLTNKFRRSLSVSSSGSSAVPAGASATTPSPSPTSPSQSTQQQPINSGNSLGGGAYIRTQALSFLTTGLCNKESDLSGLMNLGSTLSTTAGIVVGGQASGELLQSVAADESFVEIGSAGIVAAAEEAVRSAALPFDGHTAVEAVIQSVQASSRRSQSPPFSLDAISSAAMMQMTNRNSLPPSSSSSNKSSTTPPGKVSRTPLILTPTTTNLRRGISSTLEAAVFAVPAVPPSVTANNNNGTIESSSSQNRDLCHVDSLLSAPALSGVAAEITTRVFPPSTQKKMIPVTTTTPNKPTNIHHGQSKQGMSSDLTSLEHNTKVLVNQQFSTTIGRVITSSHTDRIDSLTDEIKNTFIAKVKGTPEPSMGVTRDSGYYDDDTESSSQETSTPCIDEHGDLYSSTISTNDPSGSVIALASRLNASESKATNSTVLSSSQLFQVPKLGCRPPLKMIPLEPVAGASVLDPRLKLPPKEHKRDFALPYFSATVKRPVVLVRKDLRIDTSCVRPSDGFRRNSLISPGIDTTNTASRRLSADFELSPDFCSTSGGNSDPDSLHSPRFLPSPGARQVSPTGRPTLEERIKALDKKFTVLEEAVKHVKDEPPSSTPSKYGLSSSAGSIIGLSGTAVSSCLTTPTGSVDYTRFTIKKKSTPSVTSPVATTASTSALSSMATSIAKSTLPFGASVMVSSEAGTSSSTALLRSDIFDQDIQRLSSIEEKYTPGIYNPPPMADDDSSLQGSVGSDISTSANDLADDPSTKEPLSISIPRSDHDASVLETPPSDVPSRSSQSSVSSSAPGVSVSSHPVPPGSSSELASEEVTGSDDAPSTSGLQVKKSTGISTSPAQAIRIAQSPMGPIPISPPPLHGILKKTSSINLVDPPVDPRLHKDTKSTPAADPQTPSAVHGTFRFNPTSSVHPPSKGSPLNRPVNSSLFAGARQMGMDPRLVSRQTSSNCIPVPAKEEKTFGLKHAPQRSNSSTTVNRPSERKTSEMEKLFGDATFVTEQPMSKFKKKESKPQPPTSVSGTSVSEKENDKDKKSDKVRKSEKDRSGRIESKQPQQQLERPERPKEKPEKNIVSKDKPSSDEKSSKGIEQEKHKKLVHRTKHKADRGDATEKEKQKSAKRQKRQEEKETEKEAEREAERQRHKSNIAKPTKTDSESEGSEDEDSASARALAKEWQDVLKVLEDDDGQPMMGMSMYDRVKARSSAHRVPDEPWKDENKRSKTLSLLKERRKGHKSSKKRKRLQIGSSSEDDDEEMGSDKDGQDDSDSDKSDDGNSSAESSTKVKQQPKMAKIPKIVDQKLKTKTQLSVDEVFSDSDGSESSSRDDDSAVEDEPKPKILKKNTGSSKVSPSKASPSKKSLEKMSSSGSKTAEQKSWSTKSKSDMSKKEGRGRPSKRKLEKSMASDDGGNDTSDSESPSKPVLKKQRSKSIESSSSSSKIKEKEAKLPSSGEKVKVNKQPPKQDDSSETASPASKVSETTPQASKVSEAISPASKVSETVPPASKVSETVPPASKVNETVPATSKVSETAPPTSKVKKSKSEDSDIRSSDSDLSKSTSSEVEMKSPPRDHDKSESRSKSTSDDRDRIKKSKEPKVLAALTVSPPPPFFKTKGAMKEMAIISTPIATHSSSIRTSDSSSDGGMQSPVSGGKISLPGSPQLHNHKKQTVGLIATVDNATVDVDIIKALQRTETEEEQKKALQRTETEEQKKATTTSSDTTELQSEAVVVATQDKSDSGIHSSEPTELPPMVEVSIAEVVLSEGGQEVPTESVDKNTIVIAPDVDSTEDATTRAIEEELKAQQLAAQQPRPKGRPRTKQQKPLSVKSVEPVVESSIKTEVPPPVPVAPPVPIVKHEETVVPDPTDTKVEPNDTIPSIPSIPQSTINEAVEEIPAEPKPSVMIAPKVEEKVEVKPVRVAPTFHVDEVIDDVVHGFVEIDPEVLIKMNADQRKLQQQQQQTIATTTTSPVLDTTFSFEQQVKASLAAVVSSGSSVTSRMTDTVPAVVSTKTNDALLAAAGLQLGMTPSFQPRVSVQGHIGPGIASLGANTFVTASRPISTASVPVMSSATDMLQALGGTSANLRKPTSTAAANFSNLYGAATNSLEMQRLLEIQHQQNYLAAHSFLAGTAGAQLPVATSVATPLAAVAAAASGFTNIDHLVTPTTHQDIAPTHFPFPTGAAAVRTAALHNPTAAVLAQAAARVPQVVTSAQLPVAAASRAEQATSFRDIIQKYPIVWQGQLSLKNDTALTQMHFVSGNQNLAVTALPNCQTQNLQGPVVLKIAQRMRLEEQQLQGVMMRMTSHHDFCTLLALPCGVDQTDIYQQSGSLQEAFIKYLTEKQAAGIVNVCQGNNPQPVYVVHIFPPCDFASRSLAVADDFCRSIEERKTPYLFVVITTIN